jgi:hypothetical protein
MYPCTLNPKSSPGSCVAEKVKMGAVAGGGGSIGAVAVMPSTNGSTVADSVAASLRFDGAVLQMPGEMLVAFSSHSYHLLHNLCLVPYWKQYYAAVPLQT